MPKSLAAFLDQGQPFGVRGRCQEISGIDQPAQDLDQNQNQACLGFDVLLDRDIGLAEGSKKSKMPRPTRSWLFTPGTRPERFAGAEKACADVMILDLEDAVAANDKTNARAIVFDYLKLSVEGGVPRALRINSISTPSGVSDLHGLLASGASPDFLVVPKTESADHVRILDQLCGSAGLNTRLVGIVENARGLMNVEAIATASPRLHGLMLGAADMASDLGATVVWEAMAYARGRLVAACALAGLTAIDTPYFGFRDQKALEGETRRAAAMGFAAKAAIHPTQISVINAALTPTAEEVASAQAIVAENRKGVGVVNGQMIDDAVARRARRILATANAPLS